ncbi:MAG: DedA family protein [Angelakisella sp.]
MTLSTITEYLIQHGVWFLTILVSLEYLGIPGYPGGIMLPAIGALSRMGFVSLPVGFVLSIVAATVTMSLVYWVGLRCSDWVLQRIGKNKKFTQQYDRMQQMVVRYGSFSIFIVRLIPVVRTFGSVAAGLLGMKWHSYFLYSFAGNFIYTVVVMLLGYFATSLFF